MLQQPRKREEGLFTASELFVSVLQGVVIASGALMLYYFFMSRGASLEETRMVVFTTLLISNVFLTFTDRSFTKTIYHTSRYKNNLASVIVIFSAIFLAALHFIPQVRQLFQLTPISAGTFSLCCVVAFFSVMWFEAYKTVASRR
jgi:Ca2+-transporting ATPase